MSRPRILFVGPTRYALPLSPGLERKWTAIEQELDVPRPRARHGLGSAVRAVPADVLRACAVPRSPGGPRSSGRRRSSPRTRARRHSSSRGARRASARDRRGARELAALDTALRIVCRGACCRRSSMPLDEYGVRHADAVRALSGYTAGLVKQARGRPPDAVFPTYSDLSVFTGPSRAAAAGPGRRRSSSACSSRTRTSTGSPQPGGGRHRRCRTRSSSSSARAPSATRSSARADEYHERARARRGRSERSTHATVLVLPSRYEGLGRVVIEAFARGRGVVATRAGGILDLVEDGREGLLVEPERHAGARRRARSRPLGPRAGRAARCGRPRAFPRVEPDAGAVRRAACGRSSTPSLH